MAIQAYSRTDLQKFLAATPDNSKKLGVNKDGGYELQEIPTESKSQLLQDFESGKLTICGCNRNSLDARRLEITPYDVEYPPLKNNLLDAYKRFIKNDTWYYVGPIVCLIEGCLQKQIMDINLIRHASNLLRLLKSHSTIFPDNYPQEIDRASDGEKYLYFAIIVFNILEQAYTSSVACGTSLGLPLPSTTIKINQGNGFLSWDVTVAKHSNNVGVTCTSHMPPMLSAATPKFYLQQITINGDPKTVNNCTKFLNPNFNSWPKETRHEYRFTPELFQSLSDDKLGNLGIGKDGRCLNKNLSHVKNSDNILSVDLLAGKLKLQSQSLRAIQPNQVKPRAIKLLGKETYEILEKTYITAVPQCLIAPVLKALNQNTSHDFATQTTEANFYCLKGEWILSVKGVVVKKQTVAPQSQINILKYYGLLSLGTENRGFTLQYLQLESLTGTGTYINLFTNYFLLDDAEVAATYRMGATEQLEQYKSELSKRTKSCFDMRSFTGRLSGGAHKTAQVKIVATDQLITLIQGEPAKITTNQLAAINDGQLSQILRTDLPMLIASETYARLVNFTHSQNQQRVNLNGDSLISTPFENNIGDAENTTAAPSDTSAAPAITVISGENSFTAAIQRLINQQIQRANSRPSSPIPFDRRSSTDSNSSMYSLDTFGSGSGSLVGSPRPPSPAGTGSFPNTPTGSPNGSGRDFALPPVQSIEALLGSSISPPRSPDSGRNFGIQDKFHSANNFIIQLWHNTYNKKVDPTLQTAITQLDQRPKTRQFLNSDGFYVYIGLIYLQELQMQASAVQFNNFLETIQKTYAINSTRGSNSAQTLIGELNWNDGDQAKTQQKLDNIVAYLADINNNYKTRWNNVKELYKTFIQAFQQKANKVEDYSSITQPAGIHSQVYALIQKHDFFASPVQPLSQTGTMTIGKQTVAVYGNYV